MIHCATFTDYALIAIILTAGTAFLMWLGEQITEKGIGNGISVLIFAGIVAGIPKTFGPIYQTEFVDAGDALFLNIVKVIVILIVIVAIIVGVIFVQQGIRKIPVQYAKRVVGRKMYGGQSTHIPLKVNGAGVIPVIFAFSLIDVPDYNRAILVDSQLGDWVIINMYYDKPLGMVLVCITDYRFHILLHFCAN